MAKPNPLNYLQQRVDTIKEEMIEIKKELTLERELRSKFEESLFKEIGVIDERGEKTHHILTKDVEQELEQEQMSGLNPVEILKKERLLRWRAEVNLKIAEETLKKERQLRQTFEENLKIAQENLEKERQLRQAFEENLEKERGLRQTAEENLEKERQSRVNSEGSKPVEEEKSSEEIEKLKQTFFIVLKIFDKTEALATAAYEGNLSAVQFLLDQKVSSTSQLRQHRDGGRSVTPLHEAVRGKHVDVLRVICERAGEFLKTSSILQYAIEKSNPEVCELLIKSGANVNARDVDGFTPLHWAARNQNAQVCEMLIKHGADVNANRNFYETPLHWAAKEENLKMCEMLIKSGADVNAKDKEGNTPLHFAAKNKNVHLCEVLIKNSADVNAQGSFSATALHIAVEGKNFDLVQLLVDSKSDLSIKSYWNQTALQLAESRGYTFITQYLKHKMNPH